MTRRAIGMLFRRCFRLVTITSHHGQSVTQTEPGISSPHLDWDYWEFAGGLSGMLSCVTVMFGVVESMLVGMTQRATLFDNWSYSRTQPYLILGSVTEHFV